MTASLRALVVLLAIAAAMVAIAIVDPWRAEAVAVDERALVPGWSPETARAIAWRGGETIRRGPAGWTAASGARLDPASLDAVLAALRGGRWQRRVDDAAVAGQVVAWLDIDGTALGIGQPLAATEETWVVRDGRAYLVDDWIVRALGITPWQLRDHHPLAAAIDAPSETVSIAIAAGSPIEIDVRRGRREGTWIAPDAVAALVTAARAVVLVGPAGDAEPARATGAQLAVVVGAAKLVVYGRCAADDGSILIGGTLTGCIAYADSEALLAAATALAKPLDELRDLRPLPASASAAPVAFRLGATGRVALGKQAAVALAADCPAGAPAPCPTTRPLDPRAVTELVAALSAQGKLVPPPPAARKPTGSIAIETAGGGEPISLALFAPDLVQRDSTTLHVDPEVFAILARPITAYVDRTLWAEDPLTISAIAEGAHRYVRGDVVGEWSRDAARTKPDPRLEAYAALLANPHAIATTAAAPAAPRTIAITVATPANQAVTHELVVGRAGTACVGSTHAAGTVGLPTAICDGP